MFKWLSRIAAVPRLLMGYSILRMDVIPLLKDPNVRAALDRFKNDPAVAEVVPRISAEWREVEMSVNALK